MNPQTIIMASPGGGGSSGGSSSVRRYEPTGPTPF